MNALEYVRHVIAHGGINLKPTGATLNTTAIDAALSKAARCLFGAIVIDPSCANSVRRLIPTNIFYRRQDRAIYDAILNIDWPDIVQVRLYLDKKSGDAAIPKGYLGECIKECPICFEYEAYANACIYYADLLGEGVIEGLDIKGGAVVDG